MEALFIIIFIIIGIASSIMKQQQNQSKGRSGTGRQQGQYRHKSGSRQMHIPEPPKRADWNNEKSYMPSPVILEEREDINIEDRRRTGSLNNVLQSQSNEGICNEHQSHGQKKMEEKKIAPKPEVKVREENPLFEITEDNLISSIIMAEIMGPPRSMKRNIR